MGFKSSQKANIAGRGASLLGIEILSYAGLSLSKPIQPFGLTIKLL